MKREIRILRILQKEYNDNFQQLIESVGTPEHKEYLKKEILLNKQTTDIKKSLGMLAQDPCPKNMNCACWECRWKGVCNYGKMIMKEKNNEEN